MSSALYRGGSRLGSPASRHTLRMAAITMPDGPRYEDDCYALYQAKVLRSMPAPDNRFDREHIAEEIEDLGKSELDAVESQIIRILEHFLKLAYSPADRPRYGWMGSILDARRILGRKLTRTLRRAVEQGFL